MDSEESENEKEDPPIHFNTKKSPHIAATAYNKHPHTVHDENDEYHHQHTVDSAGNQNASVVNFIKKLSRNANVGGGNTVFNNKQPLQPSNVVNRQPLHEHAVNLHNKLTSLSDNFGNNLPKVNNAKSVPPLNMVVTTVNKRSKPEHAAPQKVAANAVNKSPSRQPAAHGVNVAIKAPLQEYQNTSSVQHVVKHMPMQALDDVGISKSTRIKAPPPPAMLPKLAAVKTPKIPSNKAPRTPATPAKKRLYTPRNNFEAEIIETRDTLVKQQKRKSANPFKVIKNQQEGSFLDLENIPNLHEVGHLKDKCGHFYLSELKLFKMKNKNGRLNSFYVLPKPVSGGATSKVFHASPIDAVDMDGKQITNCVAIKGKPSVTHIVHLHDMIKDYEKNRLIIILELGKHDLMKRLQLMRNQWKLYWGSTKTSIDVQIKKLLWQVLEAVDEMHSKAIHLDMKPDNLLFVEIKDNFGRKKNEILKVIDFGGSEIIDPSNDKSNEVASVANVCRLRKGMWSDDRYSSPEQNNACLEHGPDIFPISTKADIWSVGVMLAEFLLMTPNFPEIDPIVIKRSSEANNIYNAVLAINHSHYTISPTGNATRKQSAEYLAKMHDIYPQFYAIIKACLNINPRQRPTAKGIMDFLKGKCQFQTDMDVIFEGQRHKRSAHITAQKEHVQRNRPDRTRSEQRVKIVEEQITTSQSQVVTEEHLLPTLNEPDASVVDDTVNSALHIPTITNIDEASAQTTPAHFGLDNVINHPSLDQTAPNFGLNQASASAKLNDESGITPHRLLVDESYGSDSQEQSGSGQRKRRKKSTPPQDRSAVIKKSMQKVHLYSTSESSSEEEEESSSEEEEEQTTPAKASAGKKNAQQPNMAEAMLAFMDKPLLPKQTSKPKNTQQHNMDEVLDLLRKPLPPKQTSKPKNTQQPNMAEVLDLLRKPLLPKQTSKNRTRAPSVDSKKTISTPNAGNDYNKASVKPKLRAPSADFLPNDQASAASQQRDDSSTDEMIPEGYVPKPLGTMKARAIRDRELVSPPAKKMSAGPNAGNGREASAARSPSKTKKPPSERKSSEEESSDSSVEVGPTRNEQSKRTPTPRQASARLGEVNVDADPPVENEDDTDSSNEASAPKAPPRGRKPGVKKSRRRRLTPHQREKPPHGYHDCAACSTPLYHAGKGRKPWIHDEMRKCSRCRKYCCVDDKDDLMKRTISSTNIILRYVARWCGQHQHLLRQYFEKKRRLRDQLADLRTNHPEDAVGIKSLEGSVKAMQEWGSDMPAYRIARYIRDWLYEGSPPLKASAWWAFRGFFYEIGTAPDIPQDDERVYENQVSSELPEMDVPTALTEAAVNEVERAILLDPEASAEDKTTTTLYFPNQNENNCNTNSGGYFQIDEQ
uniref:Protein kinase domain-containing protein n=1 Tax=Globodera rostochiensis TaxID=31243 RepID=A0A914IDL5_GLORO